MVSTVDRIVKKELEGPSEGRGRGFVPERGGFRGSQNRRGGIPPKWGLNKMELARSALKYFGCGQTGHFKCDCLVQKKEEKLFSLIQFEEED